MTDPFRHFYEMAKAECAALQGQLEAVASQVDVLRAALEATLPFVEFAVERDAAGAENVLRKARVFLAAHTGENK